MSQRSDLRAAAVFALLLMTVAATLAGAEELEVSYREGLRLQSSSGDFSLKAGGRIFHDWSFSKEDDDYTAAAGPVEDGTEFRTARFFMSGTLHENVLFKAQYDFASGAVDFKDVYLGLERIPGLGAGLRVGHFKQPFGMQELESGRYLWLVERPTTSAFAPSRETGIMLHDGYASGRGTWAASFYRTTDRQGEARADGVYNGAARVTFLPWEGEGGDLLHLGVAGTLRSAESDSQQLDLEPEAHLQPDFGDGLLAPAETWSMVDVELAVVLDRFSLQGEALTLRTSAPVGAEDATFSSWYAQGSVFLTGEVRPYKKSGGLFSRVKPLENVTSQGGSGAIELVARWSHTDLQDGDYDGGTLDTLGLGVNWYLNPNSRLMLSVLRSDGDTPAVDGVVTTAVTRLQVDF